MFGEIASRYSSWKEYLSLRENTGRNEPCESCSTNMSLCRDWKAQGVALGNEIMEELKRISQGTDSLLTCNIERAELHAYYEYLALRKKAEGLKVQTRCPCGGLELREELESLGQVLDDLSDHRGVVAGRQLDRVILDDWFVANPGPEQNQGEFAWS